MIKELAQALGSIQDQMEALVGGVNANHNCCQEVSPMFVV